MRYTWYEPINDQLTGFVLLLGLTDDRDISQLPSIVDSKLLYDAQLQAYSSVFMLSAHKFYELCTLDMLVEAFAGSQKSNYQVQAESITNHGQINLSSIKVGAVSYHPYLSSLTFSITSDTAKTELHGRCKITGLTKAYIDFSCSTHNKIKFNHAQQKLELLPDPHVVMQISKHIPVWEEVLSMITAPIVDVIINGISDAIHKAIAQKLTSYSMTLKTTGLEAVKWEVKQNITEGGFADNLYLRCGPVKA